MVYFKYCTAEYQDTINYGGGFEQISEDKVLHLRNSRNKEAFVLINYQNEVSGQFYLDPHSSQEYYLPITSGEVQVSFTFDDGTILLYLYPVANISYLNKVDPTGEKRGRVANPLLNCSVRQDLTTDV